MEGASAVPEGIVPAGAASPVARRRLALMAGLIVVVFASAFGLGAALKHRNAQVPTGTATLAHATSMSGPQQVSVAAIQAPGAIPSLKLPPKPRPAVNNTPPPSASQTGSTTTSSPPPTITNIGGGNGGGTGGGGGTTSGGGGTTSGGGGTSSSGGGSSSGG